MIDSHCHLDDVRFQKDLSQVITHAEQLGVRRFIIAGVRHSQWEKQQKIKSQYPHIIFNAFGIHPWFCHEHNVLHQQQLSNLLDGAIAIGECGLDFTPNKPPEALQRTWFQWHIEQAQARRLPLIIHAVKSLDAVMQQLKPYPSLRGVIHGFSGNFQQAEKLIAMGFHLGIGARLLHPHARKLHHLASQLPLHALLLESDAPDGLGKVQRNEPAIIATIAQKLAMLRNQDESTIVAACTQNTEELFQL